MEHPILFSGAMVKAILADQKTETRRVIKPQPEVIKGDESWLSEIVHGLLKRRCPYGSAGDTLWVRETWWKPPEITPKMLREGADTWPKVSYCADCENADNEFWEEMKWKKLPSIFMPRWASRITLEIVNVKVERLQEISQDSINNEGINYVDGYLHELCIWRDSIEGIRQTRLNFYRQLWDSINGKKYPWKSNPWVWVVQFKRLTK